MQPKETEKPKPLWGFARVRSHTYRPTHNPALLYLANLSKGKSRETMAGILDGIASLATAGRVSFREFPWHTLTYIQTQTLRGAIGERWTPAGANLRLSALRRVLEESFAVGMMSADAYHRARRVRNFRGDSKPRGRALDQDELRALFQECRTRGRVKDVRDTAMLAMLYGTGARRLELVQLQWPSDFDMRAGTVTLRTKGGKHRTADLQRPVKRTITDWLKQRGDHDGPLFCRLDQHSNLYLDEQLTPGAVLQICADIARRAKVRHFSPHDLRRSFATELLDSDVPLHVVQEMLDHQDIGTTARYDPKRSKRRRAAAEALRIPF